MENPMPDVYKIYASKIYSGLNYRPTWLPVAPLKLGDVGVLHDGVFSYRTTLSQLGIEFSVRHDDSIGDSVDFKSESDIDISVKASGQVNPSFTAITDAEAGARVEFRSSRGVVMQLRGVSVNTIADEATLERDMLAAAISEDETKQWQRDWVVITEVVEAEAGTILISGDAGSTIELKASGTVAPANLADLNAKFKVVAESKVQNDWIAKKGITPLYRALRVKASFFWGTLHVEQGIVAEPIPDPSDVFEVADPTTDPEHSLKERQ
jgi:hypothetical protein